MENDVVTTVESTVTTSITSVSANDLTSSTVTNVSVGLSCQDLTVLHDDLICVNYMLALIVLLLIGGWLYEYFKHLFNQC